jgi:hypothetical protein
MLSDHFYSFKKEIIKVMEREFTKANINSLPPEMVQKIALDLTYDEIRRFCRTSKRFERIVCNNDHFWENKLLQDFPNYPENRITHTDGILSGNAAKKEYLSQLANVVISDGWKAEYKYQKEKDKLKWEIHSLQVEKGRLSYLLRKAKNKEDLKDQIKDIEIDIERLKLTIDDYATKEAMESQTLLRKADKYKELAYEL